MTVRLSWPRELVLEDGDGDRAVFRAFPSAPGVTLRIETTDGESLAVALSADDLAALSAWAPRALSSADTGSVQPSALGVTVLFLLAVLLGWTTAPGVGLALVAAVGTGRLLFLIGRGVLDSEVARARARR